MMTMESWKFGNHAEVTEGHEKSLVENPNIDDNIIVRNVSSMIQTFITRHYIILTSLLYRVQTLTSHDTKKSENSPGFPHLGEIKRMRKQCIPGASPFLHAPGTRLGLVVLQPSSCWLGMQLSNTAVRYDAAEHPLNTQHNCTP